MAASDRMLLRELPFYGVSNYDTQKILRTAKRALEPATATEGVVGGVMTYSVMLGTC